MPVRVSRRGGRYRVSHGGKISAKATTKGKAMRQARLLHGLEHGWRPGRGRRGR